VIVDLAAETGGNCELTRAGETIQAHGVTILGPVNLAATLPVHASQMYSRNVAALLQLVVKDGALHLDPLDDIIAATCVTPLAGASLSGAGATPAAPPGVAPAAEVRA
jgi:NAD(P) transhydrogenase subunit alpha